MFNIGLFTAVCFVSNHVYKKQKAYTVNILQQ